MSVYRSYFSKNNTLIKNNRINNSQNPVTEIFYGKNNNFSRFIFNIDFSNLKNKIQNKGYNIQNIVSHKLVLYNTINIDNSSIGGYFGDKITQRASSLDLQLFNVIDEWDEGNGYSFIHDEESIYNPILSASNWYKRNNVDDWNIEGCFDDVNCQIIGEQHIDNGNENINIDITDYINNIIFNNTQNNGFGIKLSPEYEQLDVVNRKGIAFHTKYTHTYFRPYIETIFDDSIVEDRNNFKMDTNNKLFLNLNKDVEIDRVEILDYNNNVIDIINSVDINKIYNGLYYIDYIVDSDEYPDMVMFYDKWYFNVDGKNKYEKQKFVLKNLKYKFNNRILFDNYNVSIFGLKSNEQIVNKNKRRIDIEIKKMYPEECEFDLYYNIYIRLSNNHTIPVINRNIINKTGKIYNFDLDLDWFIPHKYYIDIVMSDGEYDNIMKTINFEIKSEI